jgi:hypothetical protein
MVVRKSTDLNRKISGLTGGKTGEIYLNGNELL